MSPRLKRLRKILNPPPIKGFKPYGMVTSHDGEPVVIMFEEYEALRLCDYDMFNHHRASVIMDVSRPTFTRIYALARQKIAQAFVEGRQISVEGGKVYFDSDWYHCSHCGCYFNNQEKVNSPERCTLCGSNQIKSHGMDQIQDDLHEIQSDDYCICPSCGFTMKHQYGMPCSHAVCPECNSRMRRKRKNEKI